MAGVFYNAIPATNATAGFGFAARQYSANYIKGLYDKQGAWKHCINGSADVANFGESVQVGQMQRLTAVDVTNSTGAFTYDNTSVLDGTILIDKSKAVAWSVPETMLKQSKVDLKSAFAEAGGMAINDSIDEEIAELIASVTTNSVGSSGANLSDTLCLQALQKLVDYHVPVANGNLNDFFWMLPSSQFAYAHLLKSYTSFHTMPNSEGGQDVQATLDTLYGIPVYFRNDSAMDATGAHIGGLFYRDSVGIAIQKYPYMRITPITGTINTEFLMYGLFGVKLLAETKACQIQCV